MPGGAEPDYGSISLPPKCTADFCLIPLGTPGASVSKQIAEVQRLVRGHPDVKAGKVNWSMHSAGTTLEGPWTAVTNIIGQAHQLLHEKGIVRIQTDIRIGSRTDKKQTMQDKVNVVEKLLAADNNRASDTVVEEPGTQHTKDTTTDAPNSTTLQSEVSGVIPDK